MSRTRPRVHHEDHYPFSNSTNTDPIMKKMTLKTSILTSATLTLLLFTGCWTSPHQQVASLSGATFTRNWYVVQTNKYDAVVQTLPEGMLPESTDLHGKVLTVDRSYRLLQVEYSDGNVQTFKVPLPDTLDNVNQGDKVVVRVSGDPTVRVKGT